MAGVLKGLCILTILVIAGIEHVKSAGECGNLSPDKLVPKLAPCGPAAKDAKAPVSKLCCSRIKALGKNPKCLCAILLSNMAKVNGVDPRIGISIPKRCNLDRPVGTKCGRK
ncbi:hypothetical protein PHJA_000772300 [Phtheirospermum japonicum]|uniref:Bifunctional inhibitor/plant lipid transfer protein/seed storage helical domain-containing protein n=1 Tax=Phtheirospermum japonicum TaxID=374723 RepID=A0A830BR87_9LAMI|nr:hypothetical protein PHJA_000772300 [Phtheirospermum japonicum]